MADIKTFRNHPSKISFELNVGQIVGLSPVLFMTSKLGTPECLKPLRLNHDSLSADEQASLVSGYVRLRPQREKWASNGSREVSSSEMIK